MNFKGKEINFNEGFYRIFIIFSIILAIIVFCTCIEDMDNWCLCFLIAVIIFILTYISFFVIEWVIVGFLGENENKGFRGFFNKVINRFVNKNYTLPFYFVLVLLILSIFVSYYQYKVLQNKIEYFKVNYVKNSEVDVWKNSSNEHYRKYMGCMERLNNCEIKKFNNMTRYTNPTVNQKFKIETDDAY